ncbi:MAG: DUF4870 domain-containing protein [Phycisphaerales bacterium]
MTDASQDTTTESTPGGSPSKEARTMAMLAHLLGIVTGFLGPLIIWLIKKDEDAFIDDQGKEALNFQITVTIAMLVSGALMFICVGFFTALAVAIANLVLCIMAGMKANEGISYRYPMTLRLIK